MSNQTHSDAQWLLRQNEFFQGLGWPIDSATFAALQSKHSRLGSKARKRQAEEKGYYEELGSSSALALVKMLRESAWWSQRLATEASKSVGIVSGIVVLVAIAAVVSVARIEGSPVTPTLYALAVCLIVCLDTVLLALRYRYSAAAAKECFDQLRVLTNTDCADDDRVLATIADYQLRRESWPLIPDWFMKRHKRTLQNIWDQNLSLTIKQPRDADQG
ncbi:MAG: hypothetical protein F4169_13695 [Gammaproteobacteria bacterium]|nr:hypothetical protein [Gammaproteobacteria bacterium]